LFISSGNTWQWDAEWRLRSSVTACVKRQNGFGRDAKSDVFVVTDFDGTIASQLGQSAEATDFCVFVFGQSGELKAQWHSVPSADELAAAVKKSD
jgi:hypothetical protein